MKDTPILFSDEMVRAILEKRKTQTRRLFKKDTQYSIGDTLWVRETWREDGIVYKADEQVSPRWKPAIFMPRRASRITLCITGLKVEPLQNITDADAKAEGVTSAESFAVLWDRLNKKHDWASNPLVWVVEFRVSRPFSWIAL